MMKKNIVLLTFVILLSLGISSATAFPWKSGPWENKDEWEKMLQEKMELLNQTGLEEKIGKKLNELEEKFNATQEKIKKKWRETKKIYREFKKMHSLYGSIDYDNGYAVGDLIKFTLDESSGEILSYTLNRDGNVTIFDFISFSRLVTKSKLLVHGSVLTYDGGSIIISAHDNPTGLLKIKVRENGTLTLDLSDNLKVSKINDNILGISGKNISGRIVLPLCDNNSSLYSFVINNNTIKVTLAKQQCLLFLAKPVKDLTINIPKMEEYENKTIESIAKGHVGARIMVQLRNKTQVQNRSHIMTYANLNVRCSVKLGRVVVNVSSNESGKTIIVDIDNATFNTTGLDKLKVLLDNQSIKMASSYSDVLDPTDDEGEPEYLIVVGSNGVEVLISIPKFSTHTVVITEPTKESISTTREIPGFTFIVMIVAIILLSAILQKRKTK